jgi:hypothetical protein
MLTMRRVLVVGAGASVLLGADAFTTAPMGAGLRPALRAAARPVAPLGESFSAIPKAAPRRDAAGCDCAPAPTRPRRVGGVRARAAY